MEQNYFQFRGAFCKVEEGTNMGNPLSPMIADCFMSSFEQKLKNNNLFPRFWTRYVDDIFAIVDRDKIDETLELLNSQFETIQFTHETEENDELIFLDLKVYRKIDNSLEFEIFHKPTSTKRIIPSDSFCPTSYKNAAFHSMCHRLCKIPLSITSYMKEYSYIQEIAYENGYHSSIVDNIVNKHSKKVLQSD